MGGESSFHQRRADHISPFPHRGSDLLISLFYCGKLSAAGPRPSSCQCTWGVKNSASCHLRAHTHSAPQQYPQDIQEALRLYLAASDSWDVYADGSRYPDAESAESVNGEAGTHTGSRSLIFAPSTSTPEAGVIVPRMEARSLFRVHGGGRMMEVVGVTSSIMLLNSLGKFGRIYTDNQGSARQLTDYHRFRRTDLMVNIPLSLLQ